jgi:hypothetical protein
MAQKAEALLQLGQDGCAIFDPCAILTHLRPTGAWRAGADAADSQFPLGFRMSHVSPTGTQQGECAEVVAGEVRAAPHRPAWAPQAPSQTGAVRLQGRATEPRWRPLARPRAPRAQQHGGLAHHARECGGVGGVEVRDFGCAK